MKCLFCKDHAVKTFSMLLVCKFHYEALVKRRELLQKESKRATQ